MIARRVAKKLVSPSTQREPWERGVVVAIDLTTKTVSLKIGGATTVTPTVRYTDGYHPVLNDTVVVTYDGPSPWVICRQGARGTISEPIICTSTTRPAGTLGGAWPTNVPLTQGLTIFETDTGKVLTWYSTLTGWQNPNWTAPWGRVVPVATATAAQAAIGTGATDLTSLTLTWTPVQNRKFETRLYLPNLLQNTGAGTINPSITDGSNNIKADAKRTQVAAGVDCFLVIEPEILGLTASTTRKGRLLTSANTVTPNFSASSKAYIEILDVGPNGAPV